jgi:hypothetical protein
MPLPTKMVRVGGGEEKNRSGSGSRSNPASASSRTSPVSWKFPHLLPKLKERFKHDDFRSNLQRSAVEAVIESKFEFEYRKQNLKLVN